MIYPRISSSSELRDKTLGVDDGTGSHTGFHDGEMAPAAHDAVDRGEALFQDFEGLDVTDLVNLVTFFYLIVFVKEVTDVTPVGTLEHIGSFVVVHRNAPAGTAAQTVFAFDHAQLDHQIANGVFAQFVFALLEGVLGGKFNTKGVTAIPLGGLIIQISGGVFVLFFSALPHRFDTGQSNERIVLEKVVVTLSPFAPHICEELWEIMGHNTTICDAEWPAFNEEYLKEVL